MIMMPIRRNYDQNWLPSIFNDFFDNAWTPKTNVTTPAINVAEDEKAYHVEVAAPGMTKEDFSISLSEDDRMTISVEKKNETEEGDKRYLRREFSYSKFQQTLELPEDVDKEQITAAVNDGVLTIDLQKKLLEDHHDEPRMIEIR